MLRELNLVRADELIDMEVYDQQGTKIGEVEDLIIDTNHGFASFVIIDPEDNLNIGDDRLLPVPFNVLRESVGERNRLVLDTPRQRLEARRGFKEGDAPDFKDRRYVQDIYRHFEVDPYWQQARRQVRQQQNEARQQNQQERRQDARERQELEAVHVSELMDFRVHNLQDQQLGEADDLLIDLEAGRVAYLVLEKDDQIALVPYAAVDVELEDDQFLVDATRQQIERLSFDEDNWSNLSNEQWARNLHREFNEEPYWEVFGYERFQDAQWQPGSAYNQLYNRRQEVQLTGEVTQVERFTFREGGREGVRIVVRDEQGRSHMVHLGPANYIDRQDMRIREGDEVELTGSRVTYAGRSIVLARQVQIDDQTLDLRNPQGQPMWDAGANRPSDEQQPQRQRRPGIDDRPGVDDDRPQPPSPQRPGRPGRDIDR